MAESISFASGKNNQLLHSPIEHVGKYKEFAMSDKEFKPNTKNVLMSDTPVPIRKKQMEDAIIQLELEIDDFIGYFEKNTKYYCFQNTHLFYYLGNNHRLIRCY